VFGFQTTLMLDGNQFTQFIHKLGILTNALLSVDIGKNREMHVAVEQMSPHHGIGITGIYEQLAYIR
jgi:hypothetical protein